MSPVEVAERLGAGLLLDGGLATELEARGADLRDALWSARLLLDEPDLIRQAHRAYFAAGAQVAITATYQASYEGFARRGLDRSETARLLQWAVFLAREAADEAGGEAIVAASVGPYGASLADGPEYTGDYGDIDAAGLADWHRPRLEVLLAAGPDVLAVETIPSIAEAEAIVTVLAEHPEVQAWVSFSCRDEVRLSDGTPFTAAVELVASSPQVVAAGVNCTPPTYVPALLRSAADAGVPLLAYPNAGDTWDAVAKVWLTTGERPDLAAGALAWRGAGATTVGGCCGVGPADISAMAAALSG
jgi:homocysteine S-methyltransferase